MSVRIAAHRPLVQAMIAVVMASAVPCPAGATPPLQTSSRDTLRIGLLLRDDDDDRVAIESARRGVGLGAEEASRTAALFGLVVDVEVARGRGDDEMVRMARQLVTQGVRVIIAAGGGAYCDGLAALAATEHVVIVDLDCAAVPSAADGCNRFAFYLRPRAVAVRARGDLSAPADTIVALWHYTLGRFGAEQLNDRFIRRFAARMDSHAWAGWVAMKILTDAALRVHSTRATELAHYLTRPGSRFDGHKGEPLTFDPATGELRQPLYLVVSSAPGDTLARVAAEIPSGPVAPTADGRPRSGRCDSVGRARRTP